MNIPCNHWRDCGASDGGCCAIDAHERPSFGVCLVCDQYTGSARGRGDQLHKLIKTATLGVVTPCGDCHDRIRAMNAKHPSKQVQEALAGVGN